MPYIEQKKRNKLDPKIYKLSGALQDDENEVNDGDVNYVITLLLISLYGYEGYSRRSRAISILECVKQEYYRRNMVPYEESKMHDNGDVY